MTPRPMHEPDADVVIVGAGPAGASLAMRLGARGVRVILLDRARFPRDTVCGEAVSPGARALLEELGLVAAVREAGAYPYHGVRLVGPHGEVVETRYPGGAHGLSLPRHALDALVAGRAAATPGVALREGAPVVDVRREDGRCVGVTLEDGTTIRARVVVAADGRRSRTRKAFFGEAPPPKAERFCFLTTFTGGEGTDPLMECGLVGPGLQYVRVCQGPGTYALCLVVDDATREATKAGTLAGFEALVGTLPRLSASLAGAAPGPLRGMPLAPYGPPRLVDDGFLVLGDATGFMDPITGEGMYRALSGAAIAAEVLVAALRTEGPVPAAALAPYARTLRERFDPVVRFVELTVRLTTLPAPATSAFVRTLGVLPGVAQAVIAVQGALWPPADLLNPFTFLRPSPGRTQATPTLVSEPDA